jgi:chromate transporter
LGGMKGNSSISRRKLARIFFYTGLRSFGGWSTTALLLEQELVTQQKLLDKKHLDGSVAYAQILPGATQVLIVSNAGYKLRGIHGSVLASICYLLPALSLITIFAALYFHSIDSSKIMEHMDGLVAALAGIILANAYRIGKRHATQSWLWAGVLTAFGLKVWLGVNIVLVILSFGAIGLIVSWFNFRKGTAA